MKQLTLITTKEATLAWVRETLAMIRRAKRGKK